MKDQGRSWDDEPVMKLTSLLRVPTVPVLLLTEPAHPATESLTRTCSHTSHPAHPASRLSLLDLVLDITQEPALLPPARVVLLGRIRLHRRRGLL